MPFSKFLGLFCLVASAVTTVKHPILVTKTKTYGSIKSLRVTEVVRHACPWKILKFYLIIIYFFYFSSQNWPEKYEVNDRYKCV